MTGYGKSSVQIDELSVEVEIKSLNSRFLDLSLKIPRVLADKELEIRNLVKEHVRRGKVILNVYLEKTGADKKVAEIDKAGLDSVINILNELKQKAGIKSEINMDSLLAFQNVIFTEQVEDNSREFEITVQGIIEAIKNLLKMREQEGKHLVEDLKKRMKIIKDSVDSIEHIHRNEIELYFDKLKNRAKDLLKDLDQFDDRLKMELALLAEKYDVTEECIRLKSHIEQFDMALNDGDEVGRRFNFILQEMNREANTINSKSISTKITNFGIKIKEELEKLREQIQNIE